MKLSDKTFTVKAVVTIFVIIPAVVGFAGFLFASGAILGSVLVYSHELTEIPDMDAYRPKTVSTFYSDDGTVIGIFYDQKRFVVQLEAIPEHVRNAFIAAEDSRFYSHNGVDWLGVARATLNFIKTGNVTGASTITQQVVRNFLLTQARKFSRKMKEIILAGRMEQKWTKNKILSVYLNEIYLGERCWGVEAAALNYFDKHVQHLTLPEAALLAGIVPSPANYNPFRNEERANFKKIKVLENMLAEGMISQREFEIAKAQKLEFRKEIRQPFDLVPDFAEAVRRYVVRKYGKTALYNEGLKVFTTCNVDLQQAARKAMTKGLSEIKARQKQLAILREIDPENFEEFLENKTEPKLEEGNTYQGLVVEEVMVGKGKILKVALTPYMEGRVRLKSVKSPYRLGHYLALKMTGVEDGIPYFEPDETPLLQGALVCIENRTGFVKSLIGGSSTQRYQFNRATQARRQPGSAFKPVIYAAAIEKKSYSPATIIVDESVEIKIEGLGEEWQPKNSGGSFIGPISFRRALELSRNICTIKVLMDIGFDPVINLAEKMGIQAPLGKNLSLSLGASEVTLYELTSAYTTFPNSGVHLEPVLVQRIEDRHGNVLEDNTTIPTVEEAAMPAPVHRKSLRRAPTGEFESEAYTYVEVEPTTSAITSNVDGLVGFEGEPAESVEPKPLRLADSAWDEIGRNKLKAPKSGLVIDPEPREANPALSSSTAYIMTSLLQGVIKSGTGARVRNYLKRKDLAGKTGTTNHAEDTWFIGFNPEYTSGVWVGYDEKRPLGRREGGSKAALPIWCYFMRTALKDVPQSEFPIPQDVVFKRMFTFKGNSRSGPVPAFVEEPVYAPFAGETLVMSPLDPPDLLREYAPGRPTFRRAETSEPGRSVNRQYHGQYQGYYNDQRGAGVSGSQGVRANVVQPANRSGSLPVNQIPADGYSGYYRNDPQPYNQPQEENFNGGQSYGYGQPEYPVEQEFSDDWNQGRGNPNQPEANPYTQEPAPGPREFDDQLPTNRRPSSLAPNSRRQ